MEIFLTELINENTPALIASPAQMGVEGTIINLVQWLKLLLETLGALIIGIGVFIAGYYLFRRLVPPEQTNYNRIRIILARYLALALEFQLGADILSTAIAPSWDQIGKLGAIAIIRTALNYFLSKEMKEEREATGQTDLKEVPENKLT
ncbi:DUF1622 domain-containing protein [Adhaeribacter rhizoryzae]|uniref:DUF1622 domain-containing protein n=1 Tax=Adhaeribacter rhizoryzae TaxID=2607907 RepID=A0A5M6CWD0_9BACT|nr:DUF1622 domain-containing protein [Adhaeribacter rhizoryzae]KAA5539266.1 DUF1622 domain-containing protein [Adhaeribacter rhizoryzae]